MFVNISKRGRKAFDMRRVGAEFSFVYVEKEMGG